MSKLTVNFHPRLAPTDENIAAARTVFENQTGTNGAEFVFLRYAPDCPKVWGFVGDTAALLFAVPE